MSVLPFIDEHRVLVAVPVEAAWRALVAEVSGPRFAASEAFGRLLGAEPARPSDTPLGVGATITGFRVAEFEPGKLLRLTGRHHFSRYELTFILKPHAGGTVVAARSYAAWPGLHGAVYRVLVVGTGLHRIAVRRLLSAVRDHRDRDDDRAIGPRHRDTPHGDHS